MSVYPISFCKCILQENIAFHSHANVVRYKEKAFSWNTKKVDATKRPHTRIYGFLLRPLQLNVFHISFSFALKALLPAFIWPQHKHVALIFELPENLLHFTIFYLFNQSGIVFEAEFERCATSDSWKKSTCVEIMIFFRAILHLYTISMYNVQFVYTQHSSLNFVQVLRKKRCDNMEWENNVMRKSSLLNQDSSLAYYTIYYNICYAGYVYVGQTLVKTTIWSCITKNGSIFIFRVPYVCTRQKYGTSSCCFSLLEAACMS